MGTVRCRELTQAITSQHGADRRFSLFATRLLENYRPEGVVRKPQVIAAAGQVFNGDTDSQLTVLGPVLRIFHAMEVGEVIICMTILEEIESISDDSFSIVLPNLFGNLRYREHVVLAISRLAMSDEQIKMIIEYQLSNETVCNLVGPILCGIAAVFPDKEETIFGTLEAFRTAIGSLPNPPDHLVQVWLTSSASDGYYTDSNLFKLHKRLKERFG